MEGSKTEQLVGVPGRIKVCLLSQLEIQYKETRIEYLLKKAKKTRKLVVILILAKGAPVSVHRLYELLWDEMDIDNPESALKTLVSRTRAMFMEIDAHLRELIVANTGAYSWNMALTEEVDVSRVIQLADNLLKMTDDVPEFHQTLNDLLCIYSGKLLPELSSEDFVLVHAIRLEEKYKNAVSHCLQILEEAGNDTEVIKTCRMALTILPFEDVFHIALMRALIRQNRRSEAMAQYRDATAANMRHLGVRPSNHLQNVLSEIVQADNRSEKDISIISDELVEEIAPEGAYVCDYSIFKDIYRLQVRSLDRLNVLSFLVIIKVRTNTETDLDPLRLDEIMKRLQDILRETLRMGDLITRYTATQFVVLLKGAPVETIRHIIGRVKLAFYAEPVYKPIVLEYVSKPL